MQLIHVSQKIFSQSIIIFYLELELKIGFLFLYLDFGQMQDLVELECKDWARKEINIKYEIRDNRKGYKAGALKKGMEHIYTQQCDFVAIFDADFQPESDFLLKTIPFLVHNPKIGLVQTRWEFGKQVFSLFHSNLVRVVKLNRGASVVGLIVRFMFLLNWSLNCYMYCLSTKLSDHVHQVD